MTAHEIPAPENVSPEPTWWGDYDLENDQCGFWQIGPLALWAERKTMEWRLAWSSDNDGASPALKVEIPSAEEIPESAKLERFASNRIQGQLQLSPQLSDRSIVTRPETPFHLPPGQEIELFVSTPLWVRIAVPTITAPLIDIPTLRPTDTWFGTTRHGELCYGVRIMARIYLENVVFRPHRAITQIRVKNRADTDLLLERLNLPTPNLALYLDKENRFWTQGVSVERTENGELAEVHLEKGPPPAIVTESKLVSPPRIESSRNVLVRAINALLD